MLVLSRRAGEKIYFPTLGVTVEIVRIQGNVVKVGVDAPPSIRILREELVDSGASATENSGPAAFTPHELNNRLNHVMLAMHLHRQQTEAGLLAEAKETLDNLFAGLQAIEQGVVSVRGSTAPMHRQAPAICRTLVVEDDPNERELLAGLLKLNGCHCATAADGEEAMEYLRTHERPHVMLLDVHMPRCDGPNTLRAIRREPHLAGMRVYCVSGTSPQEVGIVTGPGGIDGWFPKPLNARNLWDAVQQSLIAPSTN